MRREAGAGDNVGPVLDSGPTAQAIVAAIRKRNENVEVRDRGSYLRVGVPNRCELRRDDLEAFLGRPFILPADLERVMPAFKGSLTVDSERAIWAWRGRS